jgi:hypothetical protein
VYRDIKQYYPTLPDADIDKMFALTSDRDLGKQEMVNGSLVAYSRVVVKTRDAGYSVYEYNYPAMEGDNSANNNEWLRSKVFIARSSAGSFGCYEKP